ncbi:MAG TPA: acyltransferase [Thermoanaerobaculia bacterium]
MSPMRHMPQLDGLRTLAVAAVLVEHWMPSDFLFHRIVPWGTFGVRLFFVLSGYLITGILLDARRDGEAAGSGRLLTWRQFLTRRALRIFPAFYAVVLLSALFDFSTSRATLPWNLTYTTDFYLAATADWHGAISHFWSLAVEEQFYLLWPWAVLFAPPKRRQAILFAMVVAAAAFRLAGALAGLNSIALVVLPISCLDTLGAGALLALAQRGQAPRWFARAIAGRGPAIAAGLAIALCAARFLGLPGQGPIVAGFLDTALALAFAGLVGRAAEGSGGTLGALLAWAPLVAVGQISYGVYLIHNFAPSILGWLPVWPWLRTGVLYPLATLVLATLSWHFFEKPINALKRFVPYVPTRRATLPVGTPAAEAGT